MSHAVVLPPEPELAALGFNVSRFEEDSLVLQREPFRLSWMLTQLVTFVFLIPKQVTSWEEMIADFEKLKKFAKRHKKTFLPMGLQCGYALLPIYIGTGFSDQLKETVRTKYTKRWCMFHLPSLLDIPTGECTTLAPNYIWGALYRGYIHETVTSVAEVVTKNAVS